MADRRKSGHSGRNTLRRRLTRGGLIGLLGGATIAGLAGAPAVAAPADGSWLSKPHLQLPAADTKHGTASEVEEALAKAKSSKKRVEIVGTRAKASTTYANPDGTITQTVTAAPIRAKGSEGNFVAIDQQLQLNGGRLMPVASNAKVSFRRSAVATSSDASDVPSASAATPSPADADRMSKSTANVAELDLPGAADLSMGFGSALPTPVVHDDTATYELSATSALTATSLDDGFALDVVLKAAPNSAPTYSFPLQLAGGITPTLADGVLKLVNPDGAVMGLSRPLTMWDAHRDAAGDPDHVQAVDSKLIHTADGWTLQMSPSMTYLTDASTQYPVTVDPTVVTQDNSDTWYYGGNSTDNGADYKLLVGKIDTSSRVYRSYMRWNTGPFTGRVVTSAVMSLYQYEAGSCSNKVTKVYPTTTYSSLDSANVKVNTDSAWDQSPSFNTGGDGCSTPNGYVDLDVTKIVSAWTAGEIPQYGLELRSGSESDITYGKRFCARNAAPSGTGHCEGTSGMPSLSVTYVYDLGVQPHGGTLVSHRLNDHSQISVNTSDGDGVYKSTDVHIGGRGLDLTLDRFYDTQANTRPSQFGAGWAMTGGADVYLSRGANSDRWDYISPSGTWYGRLVRKTTSGDTNTFWTPTYGGLNADMKDNGDGTFTMTFHSSQEKYTFTNLGCTTCDMVLKSDVDRNGNTISYGYDASRLLTSITDTHGRQLSVHHNGAGLIDSISETGNYTSDPRTWGYHYNGANQLDSYTDPTGARTDYSYSNGELATVTDPAQSDGKRPTTTVSTSNGQTTGLAYTSSASGQVKQFTYNYSSDTAAAQNACNTDDNWNRFTTVTNVSDPQGGATKYCFRDRLNPPSPTDPNTSGDAEKIRVVDGNGHHRSSTYTPDLAAQNGTGQSNDGVTGGSTVYTYNVNNTLSNVTQPKDSSASKTAGTTSFDYATSSSVAGATFLPSSVGTTSSSCSSMGYDSRGNLTDTWTGQAATSGKSTCSSGRTGRHAHVDYNDYGSPKSAYSPAVGSLSTISEADKTRYFYYTDEPNKGELQRVVKPGSDGTCTTDRTGCTSYTYDGYSRVATTSDGNGNTTSYSYDKADRVTQVLSGGATTCNPSSGTCIKYAYDGEGNLISRIDRSGTTTFTYDWLNNSDTQTQPGGTVLTTVYDGAGNLTRYAQALPGQSTDTVNYTYDAANQLTSIRDAIGTFSYTSNEDGRPTKLTFPSGFNLSIAYDYTGSGKLKSITPSNTTLPSYKYDYSSSTGDSATLRKTTNRDGSTVTYSYDAADRLALADASTGADYSYTYDADSNIRSAVAGSTKIYYGYNEADQLCWSGTADSSSAAMARACATTPSGDVTYNSDKAGQNLGSAAGPVHYNSQGQVDQISSPSGAGPVAQTYLDQGNNLRLTAGEDTFTDGSRLGVTARTSGSAATFYTRDPFGQVLDEHGASGTNGYVTDRLGSISALINSSGGLAGSYTYDPYGKTTITSGSSATAAQASPWRFTGGYQDPTDGYYKFGARYYDSAGHFTQSDSIAGNISRAEQFNAYTYTSGDPINRTDLSGESAGEGFQIASAAVGIAALLTGPAGAIVLGAISSVLGIIGSALDGDSAGVALSAALGVFGPLFGIAGIVLKVSARLRDGVGGLYSYATTLIAGAAANRS